MKISFDFDGTLSRKDVQKYAKILILIGHDVYITTSRCDSENKVYYSIKYDNSDLFSVAETLGIKKENIFFTAGCFKNKYLIDNKFEIHFDDDNEELKKLDENIENHCTGININNFMLKKQQIGITLI